MTSGGATGLIVRDCGGDIVAALNNFFSHVADAHIGEVYALKDDPFLAQHTGANRVNVLRSIRLFIGG